MYKFNSGLNLSYSAKASQRFAEMRANRRNRRNVKLIKAYLKIRRQQRSLNTNQFTLLEEQRKNKTIDDDIYERLLKVLQLSQQMSQVEMFDEMKDISAIKKSPIKNENAAQEE